MPADDQTARVLDGAAVANDIRAALAPSVRAFTERAGRAPGLALMLVGTDPSSEIYVRGKDKAGREAGLDVRIIRLPASTSIARILDSVRELNGADAIDGILVQSPLPPELGPDAERHVFDAIDPRKDVDGFHPINVGELVQNRATLVACTPSGVIELLDRAGIAIEGSRAVVIGRSEIVGKPMALLLLHRNATVTICHSRTKHLSAVAAEADILVSAIGRPGFVTRDFVKRGATVIDVGVTSVTDRAIVERMFPPGSKRRETFERRGALTVGEIGRASCRERV